MVWDDVFGLFYFLLGSAHSDAVTRRVFGAEDASCDGVRMCGTEKEVKESKYIIPYHLPESWGDRNLRGCYFPRPSRNFWRRPGSFSGSVRRMVPGSTRIDGEAEGPVILALISLRPCFMG